ncbi:MAG: glycosyltransferase [Alphaproteobacteria bacterium]|nr:MAG: glycosyltransferase [Alphaproteobacteria bacterium]
MSGRRFQGYWQAYTDLLELHARGWWDESQLRAHYESSGKAEGRLLSRPEDIPPDWSDWLYFSDWHDEFSWWWRKGVLDTGAYSALVNPEEWLPAGRISQSERMRDLTSLSPQARMQLVEHARALPGSGPLREMHRTALRWCSDGESYALPLADLVAERFPGPVDQLLILPWLEAGGAERVGIWHHEAALHAGLTSVMVLGDGAAISPHFADHAGRAINLCEIFLEEFGVDFTRLPIEQRCEALVAVLEALRPRLAHLIHSYLGYTTFTEAATASRARAAVGRLHVSAFCPHIHPDGCQDGYFRYLPDLMPLTDCVVFDNSWYRQELVTRFGLEESRTAVLRYPVTRIAPVEPAPGPDCNRVLWASRLDAQKNPAILAPIAAELPELEFLVYGSAVLNDTVVDWATMPPNVHRAGGFSDPAALPLGEVFAFLYTSRFDGMPNIVMEIGARGVPVVAPPVGGIADFLGADWELQVDHPEDVAGYVRQLRRLYRQPDLRAAAGARLVDIARRERSVQRFFADIRPLLPDADSMHSNVAE